MPVRIYRPLTPARRKTSVVDYRVLTKHARPPRRLRRPWKSTGGRNAQGRITVRHRGGAQRRLARIVDFRQEKRDVPGIVRTVEYDPNRSAFLARIVYRDGDQRYVLAWEGVAVGQEIVTGEKVEPSTGNRLPLRVIPIGSEVFNIELQPGKGGQIVRSAGTAAILQEVEGAYAHMKMPSGEVRLIPAGSWATVGKTSNADHRTERIGSAGRMRRMGWRPEVRGKAMNPVDHPHGGGEGHNPIGLKYPKTPWGKHAHGVKTRRKGKPSAKFILHRRPKK
jgi:large subunit ribosomal protein L2